MTQLITRHFFN